MEEIRNMVRMLVAEAMAGSDVPQRMPFRADLPGNVHVLSDIFKENGFELYIVGGAVRDLIMKKEPKDYDLVSDATPDDVERILGDRFKVIPTGKAFGIMTVVMPDGEEYEIARYRTDLGSGRRPEGGVEFSTIDHDVKRRDLTINALYYDIGRQQIIDYVGGVDDIRSKTVKTVGSADERFGEDRLRVLRAIRFAARFGSQLDKDIEESLMKDNSLTGVSNERIRDEFIKGIQTSASVVYFLELLDRFGLLPQILGELKYKRAFFAEERDYVVLMAFLVHTNSVESVRSALSRQRYTLEEVSKICFLVLFSQFRGDGFFKMKKLQKSSRISDSQITAYARISGIQDIGLVTAFLNTELSVSSEELINKGFSGKELGAEMERLENERFRLSL